MRTILVLLSVLCLQTGGSALAAETVDFKTFLESPGKYHGKEIQLSGFLSLEDYSKALFLTREDYAAGRFANSVPVLAPYNVLNMREAFQRAFVRIRAVYNHKCARPEIFCSAHPGQGVLGPVLEIRVERLPENERPVYRMPKIPTAWDELVLSKAGQPGHGEIMRLARRFSQAVTAGDKAALLALVEGAFRAALETELNTPDSRSDWLLFSGEDSYRDAFLAAQALAIIPLRMGDDPLQPAVGAACFCLTADCKDKLSPPLPSQAVVEGSFADPYKCLPLHRSQSGWVIDGGFLLSLGKEMPYGDDSGVIMEADPKAPDAAETVMRMFSHPPTFSSFLTRLRERPRPRVADALQTGRTKLPVAFISPSGNTRILEITGGAVTMRQLDLEARGE